jgi:hypothetical protein
MEKLLLELLRKRPQTKEEISMDKDIAEFRELINKENAIIGHADARKGLPPRTDDIHYMEAWNQEFTGEWNE